MYKTQQKTTENLAIIYKKSTKYLQKQKIYQNTPKSTPKSRAGGRVL